MQALGLIETRGTLSAIEAADAMLKAAEVTLLEKIKVGGGLITVVVTGDVAAVKAAVDAGAAAVERIGAGCLYGQHVIPRPHDELVCMVGQNMHPDPDGALKPEEEAALFVSEDLLPAEPTECLAENGGESMAEGQENPEEGDFTLSSILPNREALDQLIESQGMKAAMAELDKLKVTELRTLAREYPELAIAGREISKANKHKLLEEFRNYGRKKNEERS